MAAEDHNTVPDVMNVAVYYNNRDVRLETRPVPAIGSREILVKILASGICGSDVMEWYRIKKAPIVLGHEITGVVVKTGSEVKRFKPGDRVFVTHHVPCNTCAYCAEGLHTVCDTLRTTTFDPGGFSQYVRVPEINVDRGTLKLPDEVSFEDGSFIEPLGCVWRAQQRMARLQPGWSVLVLGAGISGLLHVALAKALGAGRIMATDVNEYRLEAAKAVGADKVIHAGQDVPAWVRKVNDGRGARLVLVCAGALSVYRQALQSVDRGGTVLVFAPTDPGVEFPIPINTLWQDGVTWTQSYGAGPADCAAALSLIRHNRVPVKSLITHRLPLSGTGRGFSLVSGAAGEDSIKVLIMPHEGI